MTSELHNELTIKIPNELSCKFGEIFNLLDSSMDRLGVVKYSVTYATLEEVYLKVGNDFSDKQMINKTSVQVDSFSGVEEEPLKIELKKSFCTQLGAVIQKRLRMYKNSPK